MLVVHKAVTTEQTATTKPMTSFGLVTCSWKPIGSPLSSKGAIGSRPGVLQWILFITLSNHGGHNTTNENNTYEFRKQISTKSIKNSKRYAVTGWTHVIHTLTYYTILPEDDPLTKPTKKTQNNFLVVSLTQTRIQTQRIQNKKAQPLC